MNINTTVTDETALKIVTLANLWNLPPQRHNTAVIERAVAMAMDAEAKRIAEVASGGNSDLLAGLAAYYTMTDGLTNRHEPIDGGG